MATNDGIIVATGLTNSTADQPQFLGLMNQAMETAKNLDAGDIGTIIADAGYLSIKNLTTPGPNRLIAVGSRRDLERAARQTTEHSHPSQPAGQTDAPAEDLDDRQHIDAMAARLRTPDGIATYRQRGRIIETIFGQSKHNQGFRSFTGRGQQRATTEWSFHATVHNIGKIINNIELPALRAALG